jgi:Fic family protein
LVFIRKKKIKGREYHYLVQSTRVRGRTKKFERYVGLHPPSEKDIERFAQEFDAIKHFIGTKREALENIKARYNEKVRKATDDEMLAFEKELIIKYTYDTNRIEGSSLTYKDTKLLLQEGISPREKPLRDIREAENHVEAYTYVKSQLSSDISQSLILRLHAILKKGVSDDAGKFRTRQVSVGDLIPVGPKLIEQEIQNLISWYGKNKTLNALELAASFHCMFERIHPFFDGNGRVGRLLMNFILLKRRYPVIIVQNRNKRRYYTALRRGDDGNYLYMIKYLLSELENQSRLYS